MISKESSDPEEIPERPLSLQKLYKSASGRRMSFNSSWRPRLFLIFRPGVYTIMAPLAILTYALYVGDMYIWHVL